MMEKKNKIIEIPNGKKFGNAVHAFNVDMAVTFGLTEAILLQNFYIWMDCNKENDAMRKDGRTWFFRSVASIVKTYPYLSQSKVRGAIERLIESDFLLVGNYSEDRMKRAKWYSLSDKAIDLLKGETECENQKCICEIRKPILKSANDLSNSQLNYNNKTIFIENNSSKNSYKRTIEERRNAFIEELNSYRNLYTHEMLMSFFEYWTELNPSKTKMKFEMQKTWETSKRLATWKRNEKPSKQTSFQSMDIQDLLAAEKEFGGHF